MFQELMPLLAERVLILTLSRVSGEEICLNVIPKPLKGSDQDDNTAIRTPLSLTGTPQELDLELPRHLTEFVDAHLQLSSSLHSAKIEMEATAKAAQEAAKKSAASKSRHTSKGDTTHGSNASVTTPAEENAAVALPGTEPPAATGSLFEPAPKFES
jgi:PRTRC genetic system protein E